MTLTFVLALAPTAAADPAAFGAVTEQCTPGTDQEWRVGPHDRAHPEAFARITTSGPGRFTRYGGFDFPIYDIWGADSVWFPGGFEGPGAGETSAGSVSCDDGAITFTVEYFDPPTPPVSFTGSGTPGENDDNRSEFSFRVPRKAGYFADVALAQGAIDVTFPKTDEYDFPSEGTATFASSRTLDLGTLASGVHPFTVIPRDGPQARWTISLRPKPVAISDVAFRPDVGRPEEIFALGYTTSGPTTISAGISRGGDLVRELAARVRVSGGAHTLTWDALDAEGRPVPDGEYLGVVLSEDDAGTRSTGHAVITIDATAPRAKIRRPRRRRVGVVVDVKDRTAGLERATLRYRGRKVARLLDDGRMIFRPDGGWADGRHKVVVRAVDEAGNKRKRVRRFRFAAR